MRGDDQPPDLMFSYVSPEQRLPQDRPLRAIRRLVDEILHELSRDPDRQYAKVRRPSIPSEWLLRAQLLQIFYSIRSERSLLCIIATLAVITLAFPREGLAQQVARQESVAGEPTRDDHAIVFELGAAGNWSRSEPVRPGGTFAVEVTPIENWLELETGITVIRADHSTETSIDLLFKKPWRVSRKFELMAGAGPEIVHATGTSGATFGGLSAVADFMVWPRANVGWYVEPGYELTFRNGGRHHGLAIAAGLLIGR